MGSGLYYCEVIRKNRKIASLTAISLPPRTVALLLALIMRYFDIAVVRGGAIGIVELS